MKKIPKGVSQWKEYGKQFGYWDYFLDEYKKEIFDWVEKEYPDEKEFQIKLENKLNTLR